MALVTDRETSLSYLVNDADEHSTPKPTAYEEYIDPDKRHMAIRNVTLPDGRKTQVFNGRPRRWTYKNFQVVGSNETLAELGVKDSGSTETGEVIPGSL